MKISMELSIEVLDIFIIYSLNDVLWIIMCYTSMAIIQGIDQQYYYLLSSERVKSKFELN